MVITLEGKVISSIFKDLFAWHVMLRSTLGLQQNFYKARLFNLKLYVIKPFIIVSTYHRGYTRVSRNPSMHRARSHLASCFLC